MIPEIAVGAIVAAVIAAMISLAGLIIAKEAKVSEFRQAWIDSIRSEFAAFASNISAVSDASIVDFDNNQERFDKSAEHFKNLNEAYFSIALRLNVEEEESVKVRAAMVNLMNAAKNPSLYSADDLAKGQVDFLKVANVLLKQEWIKVKKGEKVYVMTLRFAVATIVVLAIGVSLIMGFGLVSKRNVNKSQTLTSLVKGDGSAILAAQSDKRSSDGNKLKMEARRAEVESCATGASRHIAGGLDDPRSYRLIAAKGIDNPPYNLQIQFAGVDQFGRKIVATTRFNINPLGCEILKAEGSRW